MRPFTLAITLCLALVGGAAGATGLATCDSGPKSGWQPPAPLHIAGAIVTGHRERENLIAAMLHGRKRRPPG